jgi:hypothetical protein
MSGFTGAPGVLSPFDISASATGLGQSELAMGNRYSQLGLGQTGATPTHPGSMGLGGTAEQMDLGAAPSLTGGIPNEFLAGLGQTQTSDLGASLATALSNLNATNTNKGNILGKAQNAAR